MTIPDYVTPDFLAAIKGRLEEFSYINNWGSVEFRQDPMVEDTSASPASNDFKRNVITIMGVPGFGQHTGIMMNPRFEIRSWGTNGYEAMLGWRLANTVLCPPPGLQDRQSSFTKYGCHIYDVAIVSTPITLFDPTGWESRSAFYAAKVREVPVT